MDNFLLTLMNQFICCKNTRKVCHQLNNDGTTIEIYENKDLHARMKVYYSGITGYIYAIHFA